MAVQIPRLQRSQPGEPVTSGRVTANVPSGADAYATISKGITNLGGDVFDFMNEQEKNFADTEKNRTSQEFEIWYRKQIDGEYDATGEVRTPGLKHLAGDPTEAYVDLDKRAAERLEQMYGGDSSYSERTRNTVKSHLDKTYSDLYAQRLTMEGQQFDNYDQNTTDARVELDKVGSVESLALFDIKRPSETLRPFENKLDSIQETVIRRALRVGSAEKAEDGKAIIFEDGEPVRVKLNPSVERTIAKNKSEAVYNSINNLFASDRLDEAEAVRDRYKDYLDPIQGTKLTEEYEKLKNEKLAYTAYDKYAESPTSKIKEGTKDLPPKVKARVYELIDSSDQHLKALDRRRSDESYNAIMMQTEKRRISGNPILTIGDLKSDPIYKTRIKNVTDAKEYAAIHELIDKPKESDQDVRDDVLQLMIDGGFDNITASELSKRMVGLNEKDSTWFMHRLGTLRTMTDAGERAGVNYIAKEAAEQWVASKELYQEVRGFETKKSKQARLDFQTMIQSLWKPGMSTNEMSALIRREKNRLVEKKLKEEGGGWFSDLFNWGSSKAKKEEAEPSTEATPSKETEAPKRDIKKDMDAFEKANKRVPNDSKELKEWLSKQDGK